jgi:hypothetical protein
MTDSNNDNQKKRGRPATGTAPLVGVRMTLDFQKTIKAWAKKQADDPNLAEAIRRLVEIALTGNRVRRPATPKGASAAKEMAGKEIDALADPAASDAERASRKRRLLKGPSEFRDMRNDHSKRKR